METIESETVGTVDGGSPTTVPWDDSGISSEMDLGEAEWELEQLLGTWNEGSFSRLAPLLSGGDPDLVKHLLVIMDTTDLSREDKGRIYTELMNHRDATVREETIFALRENTGDFIEPLLANALRDPASGVQVRALEVLEVQPVVIRRRLLKKAVSTPSEVVQLGAADILSNEDSADMGALLLTLMESPFPSVREAAQFEFSLVSGLDDILRRVSSDPSLFERVPESVTPIQMGGRVKIAPQDEGDNP